MTPVTYTDNTNVGFWAKNSVLVNGGFDNISGTTGLTFSDYFSDGTLAEADIVLNGNQFSWFTDVNNTVTQAHFVEGVLLHEIGHFVGLAHTPAGSATMFPRGGGGVSVQAGLSPDEIAAVHALYPAANILATLARLTGVVTKNGKPVFGAIISAEDTAGNLMSGTVTRANGRYEMSALPPGTYQVRVSPLDPASASYPLFRGADIGSSFSAGDVGFLPTTNVTAILRTGSTSTLDFVVKEGTPPFRIGRLWPPTTDPSFIVVVNYPVPIPRDQSDVTLGVYLAEALSGSAILRVSGGGITVGETTYRANAFSGLNPPLNLVSVPIHIEPGAAPGMRTLVLQHNDGIAYANGFLEIQPAFPDHNFDGLDDRFQRQYFPRWTAAEAGPAPDVDQDGFTNAAEYMAGSSPVDPLSVLRVDSVRLDATGATVTWPSAPGRRYQVLSRTRIDSRGGWEPVGDPLVSVGDKTQLLDATGADALRFYRVQALP